MYYYINLLVANFWESENVKIFRYRHTGTKRKICSSYSFLPSAIDEGKWLASRVGRTLLQGKGPPVPIVQEAGWASVLVWTQRLEEKSFASTGIKPWSTLMKFRMGSDTLNQITSRR